MFRKLLLGIAVVATAAAGGLAGTALAADGESAPATIPSAASVYRADMSLREVATAASGQPGHVAPPCPTAAVIDKLKAAGVAFGPCDPYPETGEPFIVPASEPAAAAAAEVVCPASTLGKTTDARVYVPCAVGAEILDAVPTSTKNGACAVVSYRPDETATVTRDVICEGSPNRDGVSIADEIPATSMSAAGEGGAR